MSDRDKQAREDQFLGALLGLAIGDALGRPVRGMTREAIAGTHGTVDRYLQIEEVSEDQRPEQGEISDKSEVVLCIVESLTTNNGLVDSMNINARLGFLAASGSKNGMSAATIHGIELAADTDGLVPANYEPEPELAVAVRGVPVGLVHAVGGFDDGALAAEAGLVSRLSHAGAAQALLTTTVARAVNEAGRFRSVHMPNPTGTESFPQLEALRSILGVVENSSSFGTSVSDAVGLGGPADTNGAIAGAIAGARFGASGIPQDLIDGLDARIYLTLAAPWFYRTAVRRAGTVIDLRLIP